MPGRSAHTHHPRTDSFEQRQADTDQDQQQQRVFDQREIEIMLENRVYVIREEDIDVQRNVFALEVDQRFDPAGQDQQKPSQRETGVHVTQQFVGAPYLAVQQRFADNLPDRAERRAGEQRPDEQTALRRGQSDEPADIFIQKRYQQEEGSQPERQDE